MAKMFTCDTCKWWMETSYPVGMCRRYPPVPDQTVVFSNPNGIWPRTTRSDVCGEWEN